MACIDNNTVSVSMKCKHSFTHALTLYKPFMEKRYPLFYVDVIPFTVLKLCSGLDKSVCENRSRSHDLTTQCDYGWNGSRVSWRVPVL